LRGQLEQLEKALQARSWAPLERFAIFPEVGVTIKYDT